MTTLKAMQALMRCEHPRWYAGANDTGGIMWVCVNCGARYFEKPDGTQGRVRQSPLVAAVLRGAKRKSR